VPHGEQFVPSDRVRLLTAAALDRPVPHLPDAPVAARTAVHEGDVHLAEGRYHDAAAGYRIALSHAPSRDAGHPDDAVRMAAWTGLSLARLRTADSPEATVWRSHPELVHALHNALAAQSGNPPSPEELARWLAAE
ncbi:MAG: hypothetical protein ACRDQ1_13625, partial [Sciscionella sp.]